MFLKNVNTKRLGILIAAVFAWIFASNFVIHGLWLDATYQATAHLWRPKPEMESMMVYMLTGQFMTALFFCLIFVNGYENKGPMEGVRFGLLATGFQCAPLFIDHAVRPLPASLTFSWLGAALVQLVVAGVIGSFVYRR